jgi:hypothetical protein
VRQLCPAPCSSGEAAAPRGPSRARCCVLTAGAAARSWAGGTSAGRATCCRCGSSWRSCGCAPRSPGQRRAAGRDAPGPCPAAARMARPVQPCLALRVSSRGGGPLTGAGAVAASCGPCTRPASRHHAAPASRARSFIHVLLWVQSHRRRPCDPAFEDAVREARRPHASCGCASAGSLRGSTRPGAREQPAYPAPATPSCSAARRASRAAAQCTSLGT